MKQGIELCYAREEEKGGTVVTHYLLKEIRETDCCC